MTILVLCYEYPPLGGGLGVRTELLLEGMSELDVKVHALVSGRWDSFDERPWGPGVNLTRLGIRKKSDRHWTAGELLRWTLKARLWTRRIVKAYKPDMILAMGGLPTVFAAWGQGVPYAVAFSGSDVPGFSHRTDGFYRWFLPYRWLIRGARRLIANSYHLAGLAEIAFGMRVAVIPSPVRSAFYARDKVFVTRAITVGRDVLRKRLDLARQVCRDAGIPLTVLSDVDHGTVLWELAKHDLYICASEHEGMSMAILEALATGLSVVTTPCGGEEIVQAGINGQVCSIEEMPSVIRNFMINGCDFVAVRETVKDLRPRRIAERFVETL